MPNVMIDGPPVDIEKKRVLTKEITDVASRVYGLPPMAIVVVIRENPGENVSVGGCLICDRQPGGSD